MRTEEELAEALRAAAAQAPERDLLTDLPERRRRRTRKRGQALLAAAAAVVVIGGTAVAFSRGGGEVASSATTPAPSAVIESAEEPEGEIPQAKGEPIEEVWPQAVFTMPAKNADGLRYRPITALSATEILLNAESAFEKAGSLEVYNTETRTARVVTKVPETPGLKRYYPQATAFDATNVAWYVNAERDDGTAVREFWTAPLAGGEARLVATYTGEHDSIESIALSGENVVWSEGIGGVWKLPLAGGTAEKLPGTDGLHLIRWPWASDALLDMESNQTKVINLDTGETRPIVASKGVKGLRCGPTWCQGEQGENGIVQRVDGTDRRKVSNAFHLGLRPYPILDRFLGDFGSVEDLATGTVVSWKLPGNSIGGGTSSEPSTIIYWGTTKGDKPDEYRVVNLAAVPPAQ